MKAKYRRNGEIFEQKWGDLATYNGEVARGIAHTPEYDAKMAEKQEAYRAAQQTGTIWGAS